ncbi:MAG: T9SS type A sorting domain-containing protein [Candidatus Zixiibacteriota bacterium]
MNNRAKYKYLLLFLGILLLPVLAIAETQKIDLSELFKTHINNNKMNAVDNNPVKITIPRVGNQNDNILSLGEHVTVPVILNSATGEITGYDILIGYDAMSLSFQAAFWGEEFGPDGCGWEYFTYRFGDPNCDSSCPSGILRVTGIAEINNGQYNHPSCFIPDSLPATVFLLDFLITDNPDYKCNFSSIQFLWLDCGDNALTDINHDTLMISGSVLEGPEYNVIDIFDSTAGYPTFQGAQDSCLFNSNRLVERSVTFQNGGVFVACPDSLIIRGDINLNEIPYEIADAVLFSNYFVYGALVFNIDAERLIAATDINGDGVPLKVEDLVLLIRIIVGDAQPGDFDTTSPNIATFHQNSDGIVNVETSDTLGAVYLVFSGNITPTLLGTNMDIIYAFILDSSKTRVLVYSFDIENFTEGPILGNTSNASLIEVQACTYEGAKVISVIDQSNDDETSDNETLPVSYALSQNYPNPFNNETVITFDLPNKGIAKFEIINILGKVVYDWTRTYSAGHHQIIWDGINDDGEPIASGVYYYRLQAGDFIANKKMVLLK